MANCKSLFKLKTYWVKCLLLCYDTAKYISLFRAQDQLGPPVLIRNWNKTVSDFSISRCIYTISKIWLYKHMKIKTFSYTDWSPFAEWRSLSITVSYIDSVGFGQKSHKGATKHRVCRPCLLWSKPPPQLYYVVCWLLCAHLVSPCCQENWLPTVRYCHQVSHP